MRSKLHFAKDFSAQLLKLTGLVMIGVACIALAAMLCFIALNALGYLGLALLIFAVVITLCAWTEAREEAKRRAGREREQRAFEWRSAID